MFKSSLALVLIALSGCATGSRYIVNVDSLSDGSHSMRKVYVETFNDADSDLQKNEYKKYVKTALADLGLVVVSDISQADTLVTFNYFVKASEAQGAMPIYNYTAPKSYSYNSTTTSPGGGMYSTNATLNENGIGNTQLAGIHTYKYTVHTRGLILRGRNPSDLKKLKADPPGSPTPLWEIKGLSTGESNDMRTVMPAMLIAFKPYIGKSSQGIKTVEIPTEDKQIQELINRANGALTMK